MSIQLVQSFEMKLIITIVFAYVALGSCASLTAGVQGLSNKSPDTYSKAVNDLQQRISIVESKLTKEHNDFSSSHGQLMRSKQDFENKSCETQTNTIKELAQQVRVLQSIIAYSYDDLTATDKYLKQAVDEINSTGSTTKIT